MLLMHYMGLKTEALTTKTSLLLPHELIGELKTHLLVVYRSHRSRRVYPNLLEAFRFCQSGTTQIAPRPNSRFKSERRQGSSAWPRSA